MPKSDEDIRLCVNAREANATVKKERNRIPTIDKLLQEMNQSTIFTNLKSKYTNHKIKLELG